MKLVLSLSISYVFILFVCFEFISWGLNQDPWQLIPAYVQVMNISRREVEQDVLVSLKWEPNTLCACKLCNYYCNISAPGVR